MTNLSVSFADIPLSTVGTSIFPCVSKWENVVFVWNIVLIEEDVLYGMLIALQVSMDKLVWF